MTRPPVALLGLLLAGCVPIDLPPGGGYQPSPAPAGGGGTWQPAVRPPEPGASAEAMRAYTTPPAAPQDPGRTPIESATGVEAEALARSLLPQLEAMRRVTRDSGGVLRVQSASDASVSLLIEAPGLLSELDRWVLAREGELPSARKAVIVTVDRLLEGARRGTRVSVVAYTQAGQFLASYCAVVR